MHSYPTCTTTRPEKRKSKFAQFSNCYFSVSWSSFRPSFVLTLLVRQFYVLDLYLILIFPRIICTCRQLGHWLIWLPTETATQTTLLLDKRQVHLKRLSNLHILLMKVSGGFAMIPYVFFFILLFILNVEYNSIQFKNLSI